MFEILPNFHPILVHFTVALFSVATALFVVLVIAKKKLPEKISEQCWIVAHWNLWLAVSITLVTLLAGLHAYSTVAHDAPSHAAMNDHRIWAFATFFLMACVAGWSISLYRKGNTLSSLFIGALLITQLTLLSTAWRGGELVYRYGLGVLSLPATHVDGHDHHAKDNTHTLPQTQTSKAPNDPHSHSTEPHKH